MRMGRNSTVKSAKLCIQGKNTYTNWEISQKKLRRIKGSGLPDVCSITAGCQSDIVTKNKTMKIQEIILPQRQGNKQKKQNPKPHLTEYYILFEMQKKVQNVGLDSLHVSLNHWIFASDKRL